MAYSPNEYESKESLFDQILREDPRSIATGTEIEDSRFLVVLDLRIADPGAEIDENSTEFNRALDEVIRAKLLKRRPETPYTLPSPERTL